MGFVGDLTNVLGSAAGVMSPIGAIAGGVSALGNLFGSDPSDKAAALAEKQHQWDVEENQKNRDFQRDEWTRQFNMTNEYNSPEATKARLTSAGLNGSAILNGSGSAIGQSSASPSAPSGASGLNAMPDVVSQVGFQSQESLFRRLSMLGDLAKGAALLPETKAKLSAEVENVLADSKFKQIKTDSEKFMLEVERLFKPFEKSAGLRLAIQNVALTDAETRLALANGELANEEKENKVQERLLIIAKRSLSEKEFEKLKIELNWLNLEKKQAIQESKSRVSVNNASARQSNATADQIEFFNSINNRPDVKHELVRAARAAGEAAVNANKISKAQAKQMDYLVEQAAFATDMQEFTYWSDQIQSIIGSIGDAASSIYGAGALRQLISLRSLQMLQRSHVQGFAPK